METLTSRSQYTKLLLTDDPSQIFILEGVTKTCPNCRAIAPTVEKLIKKFPAAKFYQYDIEEQDAIAQELGVNLVPTFTILKDGNKEASVMGGDKGPALEKAIREVYGGEVIED